MAKLDALINKINTLSGVKIIASKFDDKQRAWVLVKSSFSSASGTLYVIDLFGNIIASISDISELGTYSKTVAIGDYCGIMCGTTNVPKFKVYKLNGSSLTLHKTITRFGSYPSYYYFAYISSGEYHVTFSSTSSRETTVDINMTTGNYIRIEGSKRKVIQYYNYDNSSFCGLIWNTSTNETLYKAGYINNTSTTGKYDPSIGNPRLNDSYVCLMIPLFNFSNSKSDLTYEMFGGIYNGGTSYGGTINNIIGLDVPDTPTSLGYGEISLSEAFTRTSECIYSCGALTIIEEGEYKIYTYDRNSGDIVLKLTYIIPFGSEDNILATRIDAQLIGNPSRTSISDPNRLILYSELGDFNCKLSNTAISYTSNQCVRKKDIVVKGNSNLKIVVEYVVDNQFVFETEPAVAFYDSNDAYVIPTETFLLPSKENPIQYVNISKDYNYFGIAFVGHGSLTNQPYFLSEQSNVNLIEIVVAVYANHTTYVTNAGVHQAGQISDGRYIYLLESPIPKYCILSSTANVTEQSVVITIRTTA